MARRLPAQPPVLPGFTYLHVLGAGGFADVFLYEQSMPRRQVAVKVLLSEVVNDAVRTMFQAEANLMAQLSSHPSILTVYQASVSADGRPYLVMELCSAGLAESYRRERLPVSDVLRIAIRIGGAIETAHRAGVLHRDIKPSNILTTAYGHPVLADFGIAATLGEMTNDDSVGLSIPWSAPEVLAEETAGTIASEVWSFAATVYSLLAGRSPFEVPGGQNGQSDLIARIAAAKPQPIGRTDVPQSLEAALRRAMQRRPEQRPASILELVHELQAVESELGVAQTSTDVAMEQWALATAGDLSDRTRVRSVAGQAARPARRRRSAGEPHTAVGTLVRESRGSLSGGSAGRPGAARNQMLTWVLVVASMVLIAVGAIVTLSLIRGAPSEIPTVSDIAASEEQGAVRFTWPDPGIGADDRFHVSLQGGQTAVQRTTEFVVAADEGERLCVTVTVVRSGKAGAPSAEKCLDVSG